MILSNAMDSQEGKDWTAGIEFSPHEILHSEIPITDGDRS
jgi:hypothetical protein